MDVPKATPVAILLDRADAAPRRSAAQSALSAEDVADGIAAIEATYRRPDLAGVCVADGFGAKVTVERGALQVHDGIGQHRRTRRYDRATHGLRRVVIVQPEGFVTFEALRWCHSLAVGVLVLGADGTPTLASTPRVTDDARLRRTQALAPTRARGARGGPLPALVEGHWPSSARVQALRRHRGRGQHRRAGQRHRGCRDHRGGPPARSQPGCSVLWCLGITETALIGEWGDVQKTLSDLSKLGVRLALDDFGTGYSTLAHLQRLKVDILKIDRSFVAQISRSPHDREIVAAVTAMSHTLGMTVVGEGIETSRQLDTLAGLDCDHGQGFLLARPMPPEAVVALVG